MEVKDSGTRTQFETGAVRDAETDKGRFDLIPFEAMQGVARIFEKGAAKYDARNWEKGIPTHRYADSAARHLSKYTNGHRDEPHLYQAIWNLLCWAQTEYWIAEGRLPASLLTLPAPIEDDASGD